MKTESEILRAHVLEHHKKFNNPKDIKGVMREFKTGSLHSGSKTGPVVKNPKQAIAIAISEQKKLTNNQS